MPATTPSSRATTWAVLRWVAGMVALVVTSAPGEPPRSSLRAVSTTAEATDSGKTCRAGWLMGSCQRRAGGRASSRSAVGGLGGGVRRRDVAAGAAGGPQVAHGSGRRRARGSRRGRGRHGSPPGGPPPRSAAGRRGAGWWSPRTRARSRSRRRRRGCAVGLGRDAGQHGRRRGERRRRADGAGAGGHRPLDLECAAGRRPACGGPRPRLRRRGRQPAGRQPVGDVVGDPARRTPAPSRRELDASRLAPCTPVQDDLAAGVEPLAAEVRPTQVGAARRRWRSAAPARPAAARWPGRSPARGSARRSRGSGARGTRAPRCRASRQHVVAAGRAHPGDDGAGHDVARREVGQRVQALHEPHARRRRRGTRPRRGPPRRSAAAGRCAPSPSHSTVGWNCTNSRSATTAPARSAAATPSPVATDGLVVEE